MPFPVHGSPHTESASDSCQQEQCLLRNTVPSETGPPLVIGHDQIGHGINKNKPDTQRGSQVDPHLQSPVKSFNMTGIIASLFIIELRADEHNDVNYCSEARLKAHGKRVMTEANKSLSRAAGTSQSNT